MGLGASTGPLQEDYAESPGPERLVQYFDKARMEITKPDAVDDLLWYVSNGLLVVELVTGRMQMGDASFVDQPAGRGPGRRRSDRHERPDLRDLRGAAERAGLGRRRADHVAGQSRGRDHAACDARLRTA